MNNFENLNLTRVIGNENNQETLFISLLGNYTSENYLPIFLDCMKNYFSSGSASHLQLDSSPLGPLSDYLYEKEGLIVDFLLSDEISKLLNDGGVLLVSDENFDELKYSFLKEDEQFLGINKQGKIVYFQIR